MDCGRNSRLDVNAFFVPHVDFQDTSAEDETQIGSGNFQWDYLKPTQHFKKNGFQSQTQLNAFYSATNEKVDLFNSSKNKELSRAKNEAAKSTHVTNSTSDMVLTSPSASDAPWKEFDPLQNASNGTLDVDKPILPKTSNTSEIFSNTLTFTQAPAQFGMQPLSANGQTHSSTESHEEMSQMPSFRRSLKPIRRRSKIQKSPMSEMSLEEQPTGVYENTPLQETRDVFTGQKYEVTTSHFQTNLNGLKAAYGVDECRPKLFKPPVATPRKTKSNQVTPVTTGTDNHSFQQTSSDALADVALQPVNQPMEANGFIPNVAMAGASSVPLNAAHENRDCRPKTYRRPHPITDPHHPGTNHVTSDLNHLSPQQEHTYENVRPFLRSEGVQTEMSRRESTDTDSVFLELILNGQEQCVEDWPEGSPELDPNFRPSGSLRLRRESLREAAESEEVIREPKKKSSRRRTFRRSKSKNKTPQEPSQDPPGATSSDFTHEPTMTQASLQNETFPLPSNNPQPGNDARRLPDLSLPFGVTSRDYTAEREENRLWTHHVNGATSINHTSISAMRESIHVTNTTASYRDSSSVASTTQPGSIHWPRFQWPLRTQMPEASEHEPIHLPSHSPQTAAVPINFMSGARTSQSMRFVNEDPTAASRSNNITVAAMSDWLAAQVDEFNRAREEEDEGDEDTDSLMEWWYTVEQWDQVPLYYEEITTRENETRSFSIVIDKVGRGLNVFYKVFTECAEILWQSVIILHAIADDIRKVHHKAVIASISGGVAIGLGGVAVLVGIIFAPITLGFSLIATVAGLGVATAGGITTGTALLSDGVNDARDRKKAAGILMDNENYLLEMQKILRFVSIGLYRLREHPSLLFRRQFSENDREIQKAILMLQLLSVPITQALAITTRAVDAVQGMFRGVDRYFVRGRRKLKKSYITVIVAEIKTSANVLHDCILELNTIKDQLQEATERYDLE